MRLRKHIYFKNKDVYNYLCSQPNSSLYVESLILIDMKNDKEKTSSISKEEVIKIIEEYMTNKNNLDSDVLKSIENILDFD